MLCYRIRNFPTRSLFGVALALARVFVFLCIIEHVYTNRSEHVSYGVDDSR